MTEYLMEGSRGWAAPRRPTRWIRSARRIWRRCSWPASTSAQQLSGDTLHGAPIEVVKRELAQGDEVIDCTLRGNRMRRFKDFDPSPRPDPRFASHE